MNKLWGHFRTITRHRHAVIRNCFKAGIGWQGLFHDLSKYSPSEFWVGVKYYTGTRSPNEGEREEAGFSRAWMHHKGRNKHHFEYWTDYRAGLRRVMPVQMPYRYVVEMLCDRIAASRIYMGKNYTSRSGLEYYLRSKPIRPIHPETAAQIELLLTIAADEGEDAAFAYAKKQLREQNKQK